MARRLRPLGHLRAMWGRRVAIAVTTSLVGGWYVLSPCFWPISFGGSVGHAYV